MKILWVTFLFPTHPQDSVGTFITDAAKALKAEGHTVDVLLIRPWIPRWLQRFGRKPLTSPSEFTIETVSYFSIPRHYFRLFSDTCLKWSVGRALKRRFKKQKYDLIHAHTELAAIAVAPFSREYKVPFVVTVHGIDTCPRYWNSKVRIAQALTQAARVIAVGPPLVPEIQKWTGQGARVVMIPNGFRGAPHLKTLAQKAPWGPSVRLISVSLLQEGKGVEITLAALAALKQKGLSNWSYDVVGDGPNRVELELQVQSLDLEDHVRFWGRRSHEEVYEHLLDADVFCLPSYREAFGIAYLEAMAHGLLTLGVAGQGPALFIEHEQTGLLMAPKSIESLMIQLQQVFEHPERMQKIAKQGQSFVLNHFTWEAHARALVDLYQDVMNDASH